MPEIKVPDAPKQTDEEKMAVHAQIQEAGRKANVITGADLSGFVAMSVDDILAQAQAENWSIAKLSCVLLIKIAKK